MAAVNNKQIVYLKDYTPPNYLITNTVLDISLNQNSTTVHARLDIFKNTDSDDNTQQLVLWGENLTLINLFLDGKLLTAQEYICDAISLTIPKVPNKFVLELTTEIKPQENTELSGLYRSAQMYCTQCEAEGFRRITYYLDRPDVMSCFTVTIHADKIAFPVLLSNGNLIAQGADSPTRHYATWQDPFPKPSYLFAMVAGDLVLIEDHFNTMSGRLVKLKLYVERANFTQTAHAMSALKKAMAWDEQTYGREYDLDMYMIVAVNDFNMGAMENKGLNIFNAQYVLASPDTATDNDFQGVDIVIGHEYFHNWSGNRVTCRDWFQLSLKEGFTVFREQQFTQDITESPVCRIDDVRVMLTNQFAEDSGPLAHSVQPDSYMEINNFYTLTIYEKGSEVIRMLLTILGPEKFRQGTDLYFSRHDGQAVTTDDFVAALQDASGVDLTQFKLWYTQAGTPEVSVYETYNSSNKIYELRLVQHTPSTPGQKQKQPLFIPIAIGLLDVQGQDLLPASTVITLNTNEQTFKFDNISSKPMLSILRNFSAPVRIKHEVTTEYLAFMLAHDSDDFNRWFAGQKLYLQILGDLITAVQKNQALTVPQILVDSMRAVLLDPKINVSLKACLLSLPSMPQIIDTLQLADPEQIYTVKKFLATKIAEILATDLVAMYELYQTPGQYSYNAHDVAFRTCKNVILSYIASRKTPVAIALLVAQYEAANNMTDSIAALANLASIDCAERTRLLDHFHTKWVNNPLVINKWLTIQAQADLDDALLRVQKLLKHASFTFKNPNNLRALIGGFCVGNSARFHAANGAGYKFLGDIVIQLNAINPAVAARLLTPLTQWQKFSLDRQQLMCAELDRIKQTKDLASDLQEIVNKALHC